MKATKWMVWTIAALAVLEIFTVILGAATDLTYFESFRIVFGSVFVLFLPGFVWSFVFFPLNGDKKIDVIERVALSFALSIAIVPLAVFYLNLAGLKISAWNSFFVVLGLILIGAGIVFLRTRN
jgi:uncharacterized membrane protein